MAYFRQQELSFAMALFERLRMPVCIVSANEPLSACDGGLRKLLGVEETYANNARFAAHWSQERTVYKMVDPFFCRYIYLRLPHRDPSAFLVAGPYLTTELSSEDLMEMLEMWGLSLSLLPQLINYYASLPLYHDPTPIFSIVYTLGETLWGSRDFETMDVDVGQHPSIPLAETVSTPIEQEQILQQMQQMEERYAYEDRLMEMVSQGLINQAEFVLSSVSRLNFQPRVSDPLRNQKNYCIICNTLLRKAAQQGGVHPLHIDRMSGHFARIIENTPTIEKCSELIGEMITAYCQLVHAQKRQKYSFAIQKAMTYIEANLSGNLSLTTLANILQLNPSYLSALFHRETGSTLAAYITQERMNAALRLLTTRLQIQTVAQLCGFNDPNYFSKQFKRFFGITPQQYQRSQSKPEGMDVKSAKKRICASLTENSC